MTALLYYAVSVKTVHTVCVCVYVCALNLKDEAAEA